MRVLHFYKTAFPDTMGGVEQVIHQIARGATALGAHSEVLSLTPGRDIATLEIDGYRAHRARLDLQLASTALSLSAFKRFRELARHADVIHYHVPWPFMDLVHFATRAGKPSLVTYHSDIIRQKTLLKLYRPLKRCFLSSVDRIVATSPNYLASSAVLQQFKGKVDVIPIGLDQSSYPAAEPARLDAWRARLGPRFFLFVGVLRYYKGLHFLLEAARGADYPIAIVGAGPEEGALRRQAERLGLRHVHFLGGVSEADKAALLTLCHGLVFPSHLRSEAFGVSLLEGAMYGKPMISCEIGTGTTYINLAGRTGLVVEPGRPEALRGAMDELWRDPQRAAAMGRQAGLRYRAHFTADKMVRAYVDLYGELARENKKGTDADRRT
jgi:glycosyltransferase involved in cell wall biosynthesis